MRSWQPHVAAGLGLLRLVVAAEHALAARPRRRRDVTSHRIKFDPDLRVNLSVDRAGGTFDLRVRDRVLSALDTPVVH